MTEPQVVKDIMDILDGSNKPEPGDSIETLIKKMERMCERG